MIQRALITVSEKEGLLAFVKKLKALFPEVQLLATGKTATLLEEEVQVDKIETYTGVPECFGGRVKTLHPKIAGGILYRRRADEDEAKNLQIEPIDLVICNLSSPTLETMDIGGSTLIRSAAKNYSSVIVVVDPEDYPLVLSEIESGGVSLQTRKYLAAKAIRASLEYEWQIAFSLFAKPLRYGENPDQQGWYFPFSSSWKVLAGKELSYNNYEDASIASNAIEEYFQAGFSPSAVIIKHGNLCAAATGKSIKEAFENAWAGDPKSAFGSIVALSSPVNEEMIPALKSRFIEILIAPAFEERCLNWIKENKPELRLISISLNESESSYTMRSIAGGLLVQTSMQRLKKGESLFGRIAVKYIKSNAIALIREREGYFQTVGIGGGQPNRIDCLQRLALPKALENFPEMNWEEVVLVSDGFFPFTDIVRIANEAGIKKCVQPGGSKRDEEVIQEAERLNMQMILTGKRAFSH